MIVYRFNEVGIYTGTYLTSGTIPKNATVKPTPGPAEEGKRWVWNGGAWDLQDIPTVVSADITIGSVTGDLFHTPDFSEITLNTNAAIQITGTLALPDDQFRMPLLREDTGRVVYLLATVVGGNLTIDGKFAASGKYMVNEDLINSGLPETVRINFKGATIYALD